MLTLEKGDLILKCRYHKQLVNDLKEIVPYHDRKWIPDRKVWCIKYMWHQDISELIEKHLEQKVIAPKQVATSPDYIHTRMFKVEYIGAAKERDDGSQTATGFIDGGWNLILPLDVLRLWFGEGESKPGQALALYAVLGIKQASTFAEIKKAHRLAAKTWHPDKNKDPDAPAQFRNIQEAYEVLSNPQQRKKYNAGLEYERDFEQRNENRTGYIAKLNIWKPPLRCGWLTVKGTMNVGRFTANKILSWQEITNEAGQSMVSYWPTGEKEFATEWV